MECPSCHAPVENKSRNHLQFAVCPNCNRICVNFSERSLFAQHTLALERTDPQSRSIENNIYFQRSQQEKAARLAQLKRDFPVSPPSQVVEQETGT